ncbi:MULTISPECIES: rhomboid-like protein [Streptomycetaceae]|uniref:Uncharacterized protein n=1 Tax=Streptantibioticus cattleyicolor (strain ATCC 35852 / DSM 46488 / JCM 4925 / NBRC 14057 / NRRL 8057) TaxID=1003195 RepID=F8K1R9_STREN|nr:MULTISPECIES: rhomboid-like protein [Streptomycetaceae]AEW92388.1 hypothetical protein SCATT_00170 [Streptantibioticus cattleyicolor NRRL 8057 = DSM 46488]MYS57199.1 hypothetical protein [Streptomyces sp. SID5468]CCB72753.1 membrane protein of unknown function [Streptantibioticus cattleyicolor NRRL 8057 = DSM 46488]
MPDLPALFRRHLTAVVFTVLSVLVSVLLPPLLGTHGWTALVSWASTNVDNLCDHPVEALAVSALVCVSPPWPDLALAAVALALLCVRLGSGRTAVVAATGHIVGTLLSEGLLAARIAAGQVPDGERATLDVGPSYVVVAALVAVILGGARRWHRLACAAVLALTMPRLAEGITGLGVTPVGHLTALVAGAIIFRLVARPPVVRAATPSAASPSPAPEPELTAAPVPEPVPDRADPAALTAVADGDTASPREAAAT